MYMDRTTEVIAHFIGLFSTTAEQSWQREAFESFNVEKQPDPTGDLPQIDVPFFEHYILRYFEPGLVYWPMIQDLTSSPVLYSVGIRLPDLIQPLPVASGPLPALPDFTFPQDVNYRFILPDIETLGSVAVYIDQGIRLSDNDYFGVGAHGLRFTPPAADDADLLALIEAAERQTPTGAAEPPGTAGELKAFAQGLGETLEDFTPQTGEGHTLFVEKDVSIDGIRVNGTVAEEAPEITEYFALEERLDARPHSDEPLSPNAVLTDDGWMIDVSVDAETGGNVLINNAVVRNMWTGPDVTAVIGSHIEINAIVQINAWCDSDAVASALSGWDRDPLATQAFNVARFDRFDPLSDSGETEANGHSGAGLRFPKHWVVKHVEGDLMIVNWLQQLTYMQDNDVGILSSSGVTTAVYSGQNIAYNDISIQEIAFGYDLIIIGGSLYDINVIQQWNILCDNDLIGTVDGFETSGPGSVSTSDNFLWNNALIYNVGGAARFEALPDEYRAAAEALALGGKELGAGVLTDPAFAGIGALRVLYISGDLVNVQYAKMTNILGDSDQVGLAMDAAGPHPEAEWAVTTGSNALVNNAAILDLDSLGKTYVGGEQYSQDLLVQADIISTDPEFGAQDPDALVSEAVAFLSDDDASGGDGMQQAGGLEADYGQGDALHALIG